ncbi:DUF2271 domain-containing protein [Vibrio sp. HN007]|uniref:DUF2271 domain-containing protein n=1 Tax=Vibrio iocasae TaxID=3098914 RepID=UPI0035D41105
MNKPTLPSFSKTAVLASVLLAPFVVAKPLPPEVSVDFGLQLPEAKASAHARPYVAVWIEDDERKPVKTIQLWAGDDEWLKDLRSWWRKVGRYDRKLVDGVTSATRPSGEHRFSWDGKDDSGHRLEQGEYTVHIEVVREHGGRNYLRQKVAFNESESSYQLEPTEETGVITINYRVN